MTELGSWARDQVQALGFMGTAEGEGRGKEGVSAYGVGSRRTK